MAKRKVAVKRNGTKTYIFRAVLEEDRWPDEPPSAAVWRAYVPILESRGVATWGETREEVLKNLQEVLEMVIESMIEHGEPIPEGPQAKSRSSMSLASACRALVSDWCSTYNLNAMAKHSLRLDPKKIAKALDLPTEELLTEGTLAYLLKELRLVEEDLADLRDRYALLSPQELAAKIKKGSLSPSCLGRSHPVGEPGSV